MDKVNSLVRQHNGLSHEGQFSLPALHRRSSSLPALLGSTNNLLQPKRDRATHIFQRLQKVSGLHVFNDETGDFGFDGGQAKDTTTRPVLVSNRQLGSSFQSSILFSVFTKSDCDRLKPVSSKPASIRARCCRNRLTHSLMDTDKFLQINLSRDKRVNNDPTAYFSFASNNRIKIEGESSAKEDMQTRKERTIESEEKSKQKEESVSRTFPNHRRESLELESLVKSAGGRGEHNSHLIEDVATNPSHRIILFKNALDKIGEIKDWVATIEDNRPKLSKLLRKKIRMSFPKEKFEKIERVIFDPKGNLHTVGNLMPRQIIKRVYSVRGEYLGVIKDREKKMLQDIRGKLLRPHSVPMLVELELHQMLRVDLDLQTAFPTVVEFFMAILTDFKTLYYGLKTQDTNQVTNKAINLGRELRLIENMNDMRSFQWQRAGKDLNVNFLASMKERFEQQPVHSCVARLLQDQEQRKNFSVESVRNDKRRFNTALSDILHKMEHKFK